MLGLLVYILNISNLSAISWLSD